MTAKNKDKYNRWRDKTIAFRVTKEENELINKLAKLTGGTKQNFLISNMINYNLNVIPNTRVHKALKEQMMELCCELRRLNKVEEIPEETVIVLKMVAEIYEGLRKERG